MNQRELTEIVGACLVLSVAFAWAWKSSFNLAFPQNFLFSLAAALVAVGSGFILHELSHKYTAIRYGCHAEFRAWPEGLLLSVALSFLGSPILFAAPGAVYIYGEHITTRQNGIISLVGPLMNIALGIIFLLLSVAFSVANLGNLAIICAIAMQINLILALFNMLPFWLLDGSKVFRWNKAIWAIVFVPLAVYVFLFGGI